MILFGGIGIDISPEDAACIQHHVGDIEGWVLSAVQEKIRARKEALLRHWTPIFLADPNLTIPATEAEFLAAIFTHPDYQDRKTADPDAVADFRPFPMTPIGIGVKLFPAGITIDDVDAQCVLAYIIDWEDWVRGAVIGMISRGKKKMLREWVPKLLADPGVVTIPTNEDRLIGLITARADYKTLPAQRPGA